MKPATLIFACWIVFGLFWALRALGTKATAESQGLAARLANAVPLALGSLLLFRPALLPPLRRVLLPGSAAASAIGAALCVLGLAGALWSRQALGANWSGRVTLKEDHELVVSGPYRWVRHPIYTSLLLMAAGTAIAEGLLGSALGLLGFLITVTVKIVQEERLMMRHFPDTYGAYRARVKALVPYVW